MKTVKKLRLVARKNPAIWLRLLLMVARSSQARETRKHLAKISRTKDSRMLPTPKACAEVSDLLRKITADEVTPAADEGRTAANEPRTAAAPRAFLHSGRLRARFERDPDYSGSGFTGLLVPTGAGDVRAVVNTLDMVARGLDEIICLHGAQAARDFVVEVFAATLFDEGSEKSDIQQELELTFEDRFRRKVAAMRDLKAKYGVPNGGLPQS